MRDSASAAHRIAVTAGPRYRVRMWPFGKSTEERVRESLAQVAGASSWTIQISVKDEHVVFTGEVPTNLGRRQLEGFAKATSGVKTVDVSGVRVLNPDPPVPPPDPTALARAASEKLRAAASLANNPIDVAQVGTSIRLVGAVDSAAERDEAVALAKSIAGVTAVDAAGLLVETGAAQKAAESLAEREYVVQKGDTLSLIAKRYYGSINKEAYMRIAKYNGISNPDRIDVGQKLKIPASSTPVA